MKEDWNMEEDENLDESAPAQNKFYQEKNEDKVKAGDVIKLKLENVGAKGDWFGRYKRIVVFVKNLKTANPGEMVQVRITYVKENCAFSEPC